MSMKGMEKKRIIWTVVLVVSMIFGLTQFCAAAEEFVLKVGHADAMDVFTSRKHAQLTTFKEIVNARSGGRIKVEVFGGGALGGEREIVESVMGGAIQATCASAVIGGFYPAQMVTAIPYLFPSAPVAWEVLDGPFGQKLGKGLLERTGLRLLTFAEVGFRHFTNNKRAIHKPEDMKGLKIRVQENPIFMTLIKSLGANPTAIAWPEVYTSLQTGVVDGQENPVSSILFAKLPEVQKYVILDGHVYGVDWFVINDAFYQSLPRDLQLIVADSARISATVGRGMQQLISAMGISKMRDQGMEIYAPTAAEKEAFKKASQKPVADWLKTKVDPKLVDELLEAVDAAAKRQDALN